MRAIIRTAPSAVLLTALGPLLVGCGASHPTPSEAAATVQPESPDAAEVIAKQDSRITEIERQVSELRTEVRQIADDTKATREDSAKQSTADLESRLAIEQEKLSRLQTEYKDVSNTLFRRGAEDRQGVSRPLIINETENLQRRQEKLRREITAQKHRVAEANDRLDAAQ
jgi:exonuclease VII large subunit